MKSCDIYVEGGGEVENVEKYSRYGWILFLAYGPLIWGHKPWLKSSGVQMQLIWEKHAFTSSSSPRCMTINTCPNSYHVFQYKHWDKPNQNQYNPNGSKILC